MSKVIAIGLAPHYALKTTTLCSCLKITRSDSTVIAVTSLDQNLIVDGITYVPGLQLSSLDSTNTLAVDNASLTVVQPDQSLENDIQTGLWDNAEFVMFECNYKAPTDGINVLKAGTIGDATINQGSFVFEFRSLTQAYQQPLGAVTSKTCRAQLGDAACTVDLTPFTFAGAVTAVVDRQHFTDTSQTQAAEYFVEGPLTFNTGNNAGHTRTVKVFASGAFTVALPFDYEIQIGDTFTAIAGCQKRHERTTDNPGGISDCVDKFDNILNFQGEPHLVGIDELTALPDIGG